MDTWGYRPSRRTFLQARPLAALSSGPVLSARASPRLVPTRGGSRASNHRRAHPPVGPHRVPGPVDRRESDSEQVLRAPGLQGSVRRLGIAGIVYVQAAVANEYSLLEADYIADLAANDPLVQGMVAYAPLEYGDQVRVYLDSLMTRGPIIKGIRRGLPDPADKKFDMDRFIQGIQILPDYGLSFDILGKGTPHLDMAIKIAQSAPGTSLIIDHLLKPDIKQHTLEPWRAQDGPAGVVPERRHQDQRYRHRSGPHELDRGRPEALRGPRAVRVWRRSRGVWRRLAATAHREQHLRAVGPDAG